MSKNERSRLQKPERPQREKQRRTPDLRVRRTCERLGSALIALIQEKPINDVTVQDVLDRASVGRSTFYLHYRDKDDLLLSQLEMFAHIGNENKIYRMLAESGHLHEFFDLAEGYFSRGIQQRLLESGRMKSVPQRELAARAAALAGSLLSLLRWWLDRGEKETPAAMDELFHLMVWTGIT